MRTIVFHLEDYSMLVEQQAQGAADAAQPGEQSQNADAVTTTQSQRSEDGGQQSAERSSTERIMDHLDIPESVRDQIRPKAEGENAERPTSNAQRPTEEGDEGPASESGSEAGDSAEAGDKDQEHDHEQEQDGGAEQPKGDGKPKALKHWPEHVQKEFDRKIGKIWAKKSTAETRAAELEGLVGQMQAQLEQFGAAAQQNAFAAPKGNNGVLAAARTEQELDQMVTLARATRELVRKNPNGIQEGEGDAAKFYPPEDLHDWDSRALEVITEAEGRRRELREFRTMRSTADAAARAILPEMFDRDSKEFQAGVALVNQFPGLREHPNANEALAYLLRGIRAVEEDGKTPNAQRRTPNGENGNGAKRAIDERAFGPRVPLAPHTSGPSNGGSARNGGPANGSSRKQLKQATDSLLADADGSASSLANVFAAMEKTPVRAGTRDRR
jgi:hypothetical protein